MMLGQPIFKGDNAQHLLVGIIRQLGVPSEDELQILNPDAPNKKLPNVVGMSWEEI